MSLIRYIGYFCSSDRVQCLYTPIAHAHMYQPLVQIQPNYYFQCKENNMHTNQLVGSGCFAARALAKYLSKLIPRRGRCTSTCIHLFVSGRLDSCVIPPCILLQFGQSTCCAWATMGCHLALEQLNQGILLSSLQSLQTRRPRLPSTLNFLVPIE